ncbi:uncharacterized protein EI90DRAFT_772605 [Cantharellus anzutake]|uniref:uncharacterized protein n=1 Tax=Cantharellus anzutake TaxID=1750568 RepID=UPI001904EBBA|nr:uncharacterized protein EI90DRAFT_772605 [Cantharellus anzutake]KAF8342656.1 hypothetical protein EI90DRAFT_772605 [Cantharellus anzutake]
MGKLNIAHHKSYHPYRRDNIERVRRDEEEARKKEEEEEGRMLLADSEARIDLLRQHARISDGPSSKKREARRKDEADMKRISEGTQGLVRSREADEITSLTTLNGHINLFASLETALTSQQLQLVEKKKKEKEMAKEEDRGAPLAPDANDLKPWYIDKDLKGGKQREAEKDEQIHQQRVLKEMAIKSSSDPLKSMNAHLARRAEILDSSSSKSASISHAPNRAAPSHIIPSSSDPFVNERLSRESKERARALELIARRKREMEGEMSSVAATPREYTDVYNAREVHEARESRRGGAWRDRRWNEDEDDARRTDRRRDRYSDSDGSRRR